MNTSDLIHSIKFQQQVNSQDRYGGENTTTFEDIDGLTAVPAQCLTGESPEAIRAGAKYDDVDLRVKLWWFSGLNTSWRLVWDGQAYDIVSAILDGSGRKEWRLRCSKVGDGS